MAFTPSNKQVGTIKAVVFVLALLPFLRMAWLVFQGVPVCRLFHVACDSTNPLASR